MTKKSRITKHCEYCDIEFEVPPYLLKLGYGKFCSSKCYGKSVEGTIKSIRIEKTCPECGKTFIVSKWDKRTCCSSKCANDHKVTHIIRNCETCGREIIVNKSQISRGWGRFCSQKCFGVSDANKVAARGKDSPNWIDGSKYHVYCHLFNEQFKEYIREKFNRKCVLCFKPESENVTRSLRSYKLPIHHIDYNKLDICNGKSWPFVPICINCHSKTGRNRHHWFNLLISYWAFHPDILITTFPFASPELSAIEYNYYNNVKYP